MAAAQAQDQQGLTRFALPANQDTQEILAYTAADGRGGEARRFRGLLDQGLENAGAGTGARRGDVERGGPPLPRIGVGSDGGGGTRGDFSECRKLGVEPIIRASATSNAGAGGAGRPRPAAVPDQPAGGAGPRGLASMARAGGRRTGPGGKGA